MTAVNLHTILATLHATLATLHVVLMTLHVVLVTPHTTLTTHHAIPITLIILDMIALVAILVVTTTATSLFMQSVC